MSLYRVIEQPSGFYKVVAGCRGTNPALERHFDALLGEAEGLRKSIEAQRKHTRRGKSR